MLLAILAAAGGGRTALHWASDRGALKLVQALVAAGANPGAFARYGWTPLMFASMFGHTDIVAFLLQLPAVKATIDAITQDQWTAISLASFWGYQTIVQLLFDAGADLTLPAGQRSPLRRALSNNHQTIAALLRHTIAEPNRSRALHKARSLLGAGAASLACLQGRVEQEEALPRVKLAPQQQQHEQLEKPRAVAAFAVGVSSGEKDEGLCEELYVELLEYMLPAWADKGPNNDIHLAGLYGEEYLEKDLDFLFGGVPAWL